jgi:type IV pilus assembly protein PilB
MSAEVKTYQPGQDLRIYLADHGFRRLGDAKTLEYLFERQRLAPEDLVGIIEQAQLSERTIAQICSDRGLLGADELFTIRARSNQIEIVDLDAVNVEADIAVLLEPKKALEWRALPFSRDDLGRLLIAISDPEEIAVQDAVRAVFPREEIIFQLATEDSLSLYLQKTYDPNRQDLSASLQAGDNEPTDFTVLQEATDSAIINFVNKIIEQARQEDASDIHIEPHLNRTVIRFRVDGILRDVVDASRRDAEPIIARVKHLARMRAEERRVPQDGHIQIPPTRDDGGLDLRVVTLPAAHGEEVILRLLDPQKAMTPLTDLGMTAENLQRYQQAINKPHGIALLTGPTGTGKSTTMYASLRETMSADRKTISIEDPVEFRFEGMTQIDVSGGRLLEESEARMTFASALRSVLRSDPDIIMVGEIRDRETAEAAVSAAMTGHFLYSTLHTNEALASFLRLRELGVSPFLLADTIEVIVSQRLIRKLCPICRQEMSVDLNFLQKIKAPAAAADWVREYGPRSIFQPQPGGCPECAGQGYRGRTAIHEVIQIIPELRQAIQEEQGLPQLTAIARQAGMPSLAEDGFLRVWEGVTSFQEIHRVVI